MNTPEPPTKDNAAPGSVNPDIETVAMDGKSACIICEALRMFADSQDRKSPVGGNKAATADYIRDTLEEVWPSHGAHTDSGLASDANAPLAQSPCSAKDWPEDFQHENGNCQCQCIYCAGYFIGHKRRFVCKECDGLPGETVASSPNVADQPRLADRDNQMQP